MRYLLLPGAGGSSWIWHLVEAELRRRGHDAVAVGFTVGEGYGLPEHARETIDAADGSDAVVLVAQSMGAFTAALAAERLPVRELAFLNGMIPLPGETAGEWWDATGHGAAVRENDRAAGRELDPGFGLETYFAHDLSPEQREELSRHGESEGEAAFTTPCDFAAWPAVPLRVIAGRDDRFFPLAFQRRVALERLGHAVDEVDGGHLAALSHPEQVVDLLLAPGPTFGSPPER